MKTSKKFIIISFVWSGYEFVWHFCIAKYLDRAMNANFEEQLLFFESQQGKSWILFDTEVKTVTVELHSTTQVSPLKQKHYVNL